MKHIDIIFPKKTLDFLKRYVPGDFFPYGVLLRKLDGDNLIVDKVSGDFPLRDEIYKHKITINVSQVNEYVKSEFYYSGGELNFLGLWLTGDEENINEDVLRDIFGNVKNIPFLFFLYINKNSIKGYIYDFDKFHELMAIKMDEDVHYQVKIAE